MSQLHASDGFGELSTELIVDFVLHKDSVGTHTRLLQQKTSAFMIYVQRIKVSIKTRNLPQTFA